jgi:L,D-peptidoglycan transpeptidase YkuD (ErfK/YbiS/YcfS/YnhG family)
VDIVLVNQSLLRCDGRDYACAIGKAGLVAAEDKREGDGKTPCGTYPLRACFYRPDKFAAPPQTGLLIVPLHPDMGWCDDPQHPRYNQLVRLPFSARHERLWREEDDCYDVIIPLGYNDEPIHAGRGSAIFLHVAKPDYAGTEGCLALAKVDLLTLLPALNQDSYVIIAP